MSLNSFSFIFIGLWSRGKIKFFRLLQLIPAIRSQIDAQLAKTEAEFDYSMKKSCLDLEYNYELPAKGLESHEILKLVDKHLQRGEYDWRGGHVSGAVYAYNTELLKLIADVYGKASYTNPLHPDIFPGICKMEADVVRMVCTLFHGDDNSCGTVIFKQYFP